MENNKAPIFALRVAGVIIGVALFKLIDFKNFQLENPGIGIVYLLTLIFIIYVLINNARKK
jgi:hypothetical protein